MERKSHWDNIYLMKDETEVSWHQTHLEKSLQLISLTGVDEEGQIIDVGGGASTLVDDLLDRNYKHVTVLDISATAIEKAKCRLGLRANQVTWFEADITKVTLPRQIYDVWHDRAVFHFMTSEEDRRKYIGAVKHSLKPKGHIIVAAFGPEGPKRCSGLNIVRYDADQLHDEFGNSFQLIQSFSEDHITPFGAKQQFIYCYCRVC